MSALGASAKRVSARDTGALNTIAPPVRRVRHVDRTPPSRVASVDARANGATVNINWPAVTDVDLAGYRVSGQLVGSPPWQSSLLTATSAQLTNVAAGRWRYTVSAIDQQNNAAIPSPSDDAQVYSATLQLARTPTAESQIAVEGRSSAAALVTACAQ